MSHKEHKGRARHAAQRAHAACRAGRACTSTGVQGLSAPQVEAPCPVRPREGDNGTGFGRSAAGRVSLGQSTHRAHAWDVRWVVRAVSVYRRQARGHTCCAARHHKHLGLRDVLMIDGFYVLMIDGFCVRLFMRTPRAPTEPNCIVLCVWFVY
jgi:hypothetical protein